MKIYLVGGAVRDKLMGKKPSDLDYTVVMPKVEGDPYLAMVNRLEMQGFTVFRNKENKPIGHEHFTARALFPKGHKNAGIGADFVLARKEGTYSDGRHPDEVHVGTLHSDLARRDFTMNAIALHEDSEELIDPFGGQRDIQDRIIRAVGDPFDRLEEDALRALRALRFAVTLGFKIESELFFAMTSAKTEWAIVKNISDERIMDELNKMFKHDTLATLKMLNDFPSIRDAAFGGKVNLEATMKQKGFN